MVFYKVNIPNKNYYGLPGVVYSRTFIGLMTIVSMFGYTLFVFLTKVDTFTFIVTSAILFVSFVLLFYYLYKDLQPGREKYSAVQTFGFNVLFNTVILMIYAVYNTQRYLLALLGLTPMFGFGIFLFYVGHRINNKV